MFEGNESILRRLERALAEIFGNSSRAFDPARVATSLVEFERRFETLPWMRYRRLDVEHRSRTLSVPAWFPDWHLVQPADVRELARISGRPVAAGGLFSMHPDGHLREAAVLALAEADDSRSIPFLLIRTGDWVAEVRAAAQSAVERRLARGELLDFLPAVLLLESQAKESTRAGEFATRVLDRLAREIDFSALLDGLVGKDVDLRRGCADLLVARGRAVDALERALRQSDSVTKHKVGAAVLLHSDVSDATLRALWNSDQARLRARALHRMQVDGLAQALACSREGLFDRSDGVREVAQRYLSAQGADPRQQYLDQLATHAIALLGLAEVGNASDAELIRPFLDDARARFRAAALRALHRWLGEQVQSIALGKLDDPSGAVRRAAWRVIGAQRLEAGVQDAIWQRTRSTEEGVARKRAFIVFGRQSRWQALLFACRAIASDDAGLWDFGAALFANALARWNASGATPAAEQLAEIERLEGVVRTRMSPTSAAELHDILKHAR